MLAEKSLLESHLDVGTSAKEDKKAKSSNKVKAPKVDLRSPKVAWPTLLLFIACWISWGSVLYFSLSGSLSYGISLLLMSVIAFVAFTPMHDAVHKSVARAKWLNEVVGRLSVFFLVAPFPAFRFVHLEHHKHTNHEHKDPDLWSGKGPVWLLPIRWITQDLHYYVIFLQTWKKHSTFAKIETVVSAIFLWGSVAFCFWMGYGKEVMFLWVLPARIAIPFLAYTFDYLPHKPHKVLSADNRYKATLVRPNPLLTPILLYQNFHLIHHLYPGLPFYRYAEVWRKQKTFLLEQGVEVRSIWGTVLPNPTEKTTEK